MPWLNDDMKMSNSRFLLMQFLATELGVVCYTATETRIGTFGSERHL